MFGRAGRWRSAAVPPRAPAALRSSGSRLARRRSTRPGGRRCPPPAKASARIRPASCGSSRGSSRSEVSTSATWPPSVRTAGRARSRPARHHHDQALGNLSVTAASRFVQYSTPSSPSIGGIDGTEPVATRSRSNASSRSPAATTPARAPGPRRAPARPGAGRATSPATSRHAAGYLVAMPEHALRVDRPGHRLAPPGAQPGRRHRLRRPQQRLGGHAGEVRALAAHELALDQRDRRVGLVLAQRPGERLAQSSLRRG